MEALKDTATRLVSSAFLLGEKARPCRGSDMDIHSFDSRPNEGADTKVFTGTCNGTYFVAIVVEQIVLVRSRNGTFGFDMLMTDEGQPMLPEMAAEDVLSEVPQDARAEHCWLNGRWVSVAEWWALLVAQRIVREWVADND